MSNDRLVKELDDRTLLQAQGLHDRQHPLDETAAAGAVAAKGAAPPQHGTTLHTLGVVVGWLDALHGHKRPQARKHRQ
jgi:hypothetical protein